MRLEGGGNTFIHNDEDENDSEEYVDENTVAVEGKKSTNLKATRGTTRTGLK